MEIVENRGIVSNGSKANGRNTEKAGDAELPESQCSCSVSSIRGHGTLRPS